MTAKVSLDASIARQKSQIARSDMHASRLWNQLPDSFRQPRQSCLDSPPHSLVTCQLVSVIIPTLIVHHSFTLSVQAQNLPFQQILPTLNTSSTLDYLHRTGLNHASRFIFS